MLVRFGKQKVTGVVVPTGGREGAGQVEQEGGALAAGRLGEVFHVETFVGGYDHPCNFWHSDAEISGGAIYDWGSHYLDWVLDLLPQEVEWVSATTHKRVWHDVTNADHSRVLLHFTDGVLETTSPDDTPFDTHRIETLLNRETGSCEDLARRLLAALQADRATGEFHVLEFRFRER